MTKACGPGSFAQRTRRASGALALITLLTLAGTASAGQPRSFEAWLAQGHARYGTVASRAESACLSLYGENDGKAGPCFIAGMLPVIQRTAAMWEEAMAEMPIGQIPACKSALNEYVRASRKLQRANLIFLRSHRHESLTAIVSGLLHDPYVTLRYFVFEAQEHAVRACG
jgi:hypothetical protein